MKYNDTVVRRGRKYEVRRGSDGRLKGWGKCLGEVKTKSKATSAKATSAKATSAKR